MTDVQRIAQDAVAQTRRSADPLKAIAKAGVIIVIATLIAVFISVTYFRNQQAKDAAQVQASAGERLSQEVKAYCGSPPPDAPIANLCKSAAKVAAAIPTTPPPTPHGDQGPVGPSGAQGPTGDTGLGGLPGLAGLAGLIGPSGSAGPGGSIGPSGGPGPSGDAGPSGAAGSTGPSGAAGPSGNVGSAGPSGSTGPSGAAGPSGPAGYNGTNGSPAASFTYTDATGTTTCTRTGGTDTAPSYTCTHTVP